jgi:hypothetical protein
MNCGFKLSIRKVLNIYNNLLIQTAMKRYVKLTGILLVLLTIASGCIFAHHRMKERMDRDQMRRHERVMDRRQMGPRGQYMYSAPMNGRRGQFGQGQMRGMNPMGRGMMQPGNMVNRIPNLTPKQRQEIADIRQKEMTEMMKFREETQAKVQTMRMENRKKIMDLLTDEQKRFLESGPAIPNTPAPAK